MNRDASSNAAELRPLPHSFAYRLDLARAATPRLLRARPIHRWFGFPHSYSPELVEAVLEEWKLPRGTAILDPFVGAGTTLLVAQQSGYSSVGTDLSPLAVLVSRVKVTPFDMKGLKVSLDVLRLSWNGSDQGRDPMSGVTCGRLERAFTPAELSVLIRLREAISCISDQSIRDFFLAALLSIVPEFSRAVSDGGWFRWVQRPDQADRIPCRLWERARGMINDLLLSPPRLASSCEVQLLDARDLHLLQPRRFDAVITSPPYPNRHDYSRIFQIELLLLGEREDDITELRYRSLRSQVEARKLIGGDSGNVQDELCEYREPDILCACLNQLPEHTDRRVRRMMQGYFEDMYLVLRSARTVLNPGARLALVVGNVRHAGVLFPVDEILLDVAQQLGYRPLQSWVVRLRGNSAQQMGRFGRVPSRETVVMLEWSP